MRPLESRDLAAEGAIVLRVVGADQEEVVGASFPPALVAPQPNLRRTCTEHVQSEEKRSAGICEKHKPG